LKVESEDRREMRGRMPVQHFRELIAWQKAMDMVVEVYRLSRCFPREEIYGLTNQLRRAAVSVPSNIAEGQGRGIGPSFLNHLRIAKGSLQEVQTQVLIAERLEFIDELEALAFQDLSAEVGRLLGGLIRSLEE
jgi:four helix bundle protein